MSTVSLWHSLKTRITLATLAIFLVGIWSLALSASAMLREDMLRMLGEQQRSAVTFMANEINAELIDRMKVLELAAGTIPSSLKNGADGLQKFLDQRVILHSHFNEGVIAYWFDGKVITEAARPTKARGANFMDIDTIAKTLREGRSTVGQLVLGKNPRAPTFGIAAPVRDESGKVIGAVAGVIDLARPNFLDKLAESSYARGGYYLLEEPRGRFIITGSDRSRLMQPLPAPGVNPLIDRHVAGYDDTGITVNPLGVEVLASARRVPAAGWFLVAALPTEEAFAPIRAMQRRVFLLTLALTVLAGALTWWMLKRQLAPMLTAVRALRSMVGGAQSLQALPIARHDEIGELVSGFNHLLDDLSRKEESLRESEFRWKFAIEGSGDGVWDWDIRTDEAKYSRRWKEMLGYDEGDILPTNQEWVDRIHPDDRSHVAQTMQDYLDGKTAVYVVEYRLRCKDGSYKWILGRGMVVSRDADGKPLRMIGTHTDVTARKHGEVQVRESAERLRATIDSALDGVISIDSRGTLIDFNPAAEAIFGWRKEDVLGQPMADLLIPPRHREAHQHGLARYSQTRQARIMNQRVEITALNREGTEFPVELTITAIRQNDEDLFTAYIRDITGRKRMEEQVRQLAFHDVLTQLPNRRLLGDRLSQTMAASKRSGCHGALMFIDLDNFKPLNDTHGHGVGDLLLIEAADRLKACVREMDTVARFGGDEFVVMISELTADRAESRAQAAFIAEKILASLARVYLLTVESAGAADTAVEHRCTASIGVALFLDHQASEDDILRWADAAMYRAKEAGRNQIRFHDEHS